MPKVLAFGLLILCFGFGTALAAKCNENQLEVVKSNSPDYKVGKCFGKEKDLNLNPGECVSFKDKNGLTKKKCGEYSDKKGLIGFIESLINRALSQHFVGNNPYCERWNMRNEQNIVFCILKNQLGWFLYRKSTNSVDLFIEKGGNTFQLPLNDFQNQEGAKKYRLKGQTANSIWKYINELDNNWKCQLNHLKKGAVMKSLKND